MKHRRLYVLIFFSGITFSHAPGQTVAPLDSAKVFFASLSLHKGSIFTDSKDLESLAQSHPLMLQVDFSFMNNTQKAWSQCNCYSKTGLSFSYIDFKNPDSLGRAISVSLFAEPYLYYRQHFQFSLRGGAGLTYLNKIYDPLTNPENLFVSRHVSFLLTLGVAASYQINPTLQISLSSQFNHISNGNTQYPNWGINFPTLALGVQYQLNRQKLLPRSHENLSTHPLKLLVHGFAGRHLEKGEKRLVTGINLGLVKQVSRVNGVGLGADVTYDAINEFLEVETGEPHKTMVASLSLQHYFFFKNLLFGQQLAYYVLPPNPDVKKLYQFYLLEYHVTRQWYAGVSLKAHGSISDYVSFSIGKVILLK